MVIKCPNCGGHLQYDAPTGRMLCAYCSSSFDVREFDRVSASDETMDTEIYTCTSCGAELIVNNVESATFCAYCGQPTIVFSRISKMRKPKYILPFTITKERAHDIIRSQFSSGQYIPESVKNFKPELIRGIYIPYMLYDVKYYDRQLIRSDHKRGRSSTTYYYYREAGNHFTNITVDSSANFNDESSQRLEPFDLKNMQPFSPSYLSGYYADCMDDAQEKMRSTALQRSQVMFDEAVLKTVSGSNKTIIEKNPSVEVTNADYVMLPVWFLVFNEDNLHHTILVNGQTGKAVGAVPCDRKKARGKAALLCTLFSVLFSTLLGPLFLFLNGDDRFKLGFLFILIGAFLLFFDWHMYKSYKTSLELTTAGQIKRLASERQEV